MGSSIVSFLLMRMTMVVMMAARNTKPPNTPRAIIPPRLSCACLLSGLPSTAWGTSAPASLLSCTLELSGISLSIGGLGEKISWSDLVLSGELTGVPAWDQRPPHSLHSKLLVLVLVRPPG